MQEGLNGLPEYIDALIEKLTPARRKQLAKEIAKEVRASQAKRIRTQLSPDGDKYEGRKNQPAKREIKFAYITGDGIRHLRSWRETKHYIIGYDIYAGGIRTFKKKRITRWIHVDRSKTSSIMERNKSSIRKKMFSGLIKSRWMKGIGTAEMAEVSFKGVAERVAMIHHYGLRDRVNKNGAEYDYPERKLLGITSQEASTIEELIIQHLE